jgi:hypothetical protein
MNISDEYIKIVKTKIGYPKYSVITDNEIKEIINNSVYAYLGPNYHSVAQDQFDKILQNNSFKSIVFGIAMQEQGLFALQCELVHPNDIQLGSIKALKLLINVGRKLEKNGRKKLGL